MGAGRLPAGRLGSRLLLRVARRQVEWQGGLLHGRLPVRHPHHTAGPGRHPGRGRGRHHLLPEAGFHQTGGSTGEAFIPCSSSRFINK